MSGQHLLIDCQAEGIPEPQIRWKVETSASSSTGKLASDVLRSGGGGGAANSNSFHAVISNAHMQTLENGTLLIKEVNRDDHRRYMCSGKAKGTTTARAEDCPPAI